MRNKKWQCRLLSLALCASLTVPCLSVPVYASQAILNDVDTVGFVSEEPAAEIMTEMTEISVEPEEIISSLGSFENVSLSYYGFCVSVEGIFNYAGSETATEIPVRLVQYDKDNNRLYGFHINTVSQTEAGEIELFQESITVLKDTAYFRLEAGDGDSILCSEKIEAQPRPEVTFESRMLDVGAASVGFEISYSGDMNLDEKHYYQSVNFDLNVGTSEDESTWKNEGSCGTTIQEGKTQNVWYSYLDENTTYYGELIVSIDAYDYESNNYTPIRAFEQRIPLSPFTTKQNETYSIESIFPDEVLRDIILEKIISFGYSVIDGNVTSEMLEVIDYLNVRRHHLDEPAIRDITGIDRLIRMKQLDLGNHEIADVAGIDWAKLIDLNYLYLKGNEFTRMPDLSKNSRLTSLNLEENKLSAEELATLESKLPPKSGYYIISDAKESQRVNGFELVVEDNYYVYSSGACVYIKAKGYKTDLPYTVKFYLDDVETEFEKHDRLYALRNTDLSAGPHTLKAELYYGTTKVEETAEYTFSVVEQPVFAGNTPIYISGDTRGSDSWTVSVYSLLEGAEIESVEVVDDTGKQYMEVTIGRKNWINVEPRFEKISSSYPVNEDVRMQSVNAEIRAVYNTTPEGSYDLKLNFSDGSFRLVENAMIVAAKEESVITHCFLGSPYDQTGKYLYINIYGKNLEPDKLSYTIEQLGKTYPVTYVNHKPTNGGAVVKVQKNDWITFDAAKEDIYITVSGGTEASTITGRSLWESGVYYVDYNLAINKVEIAVTEDLNSNGKTVKAYLKTGKEEPVLAEAESVITDGTAYLEFKNPDGSKYQYSARSYYVEYEIDSRTYSKGFSIPWLPSAKTVAEAESVTMDNDGDDKTAMDLTGTVKYVSDGEVVIPMEDNAELSQAIDQEAEAAEAKKFIINSIYTTWNSETEIGITVNSPTVAKKDKYTVTLTDYNGIQPEGLTVTTQIYNNRVYFAIKGLNYKDAAKKYYIKITHNTLGEPYNSTGTTPFYTDERGQYTQIFNSSVSYTTVDQKMVALSFWKMELPIKVQVYKPYDTELIQEVEIKNQTQLINGWYNIDKEFCDNLPVKDMIYDIICIRADGRVEMVNEVIDCEENLRVKWNYTVDKKNLAINDEENNTAVIQVTGNNGKPVFKSSDNNVVTVKADSTDANKAVITAVGIGTAQISITVDGATRKFTVVSERKVTLEKVELNKNEMTLGIGDSQKLMANVFPAEAWNEELEIVFTTDNPEVIQIEEDTAGTVVLTALKEGSAIVTAAITGTELAAQCTITVEKVFSEAEKRDLIKQASENYVLANVYPQMTATLKDVALPAGWSWVDASMKLTVDEAVTVQYYAAKYKETGYEEFTTVLPVAVSKLTGIRILGDEIITAQKTKTYRAVCNYMGYQPKAEEFSGLIGFCWDIPDLTAIDETNVDGGSFAVRAKDVEKNTSAEITLAVTLGGIEYKDSLPITVTSSPCVDEIQVVVSEEQPATEIKKFEYNKDGKVPEIIIDSRDISTQKNEVSNALKVLAKAFAGNSPKEDLHDFKWSSSDSSVVDVKQESNKAEAVLTFKKPGTAVVHIVAQDAGKYDREILVSIKDYTPVAETSKIKLDLFAEDGVIIPVKAQNGNSITGIMIEEQDSKTKEWKNSSKFKVEKEENVFRLKVTDGYKPAKNENVKVQLKITTDKIEEVILTATVSVNVKTKPTASLKMVSKANLFYVNADACYRIDSKYEIESIEDITVKEGDNYRGRTTEKGYRLTEVDVQEGYVRLDTGDTLTAESVKDFKAKKSPLCQVTLKVNFKGYTDAADQILNLTVATEDKKPSLKLNDIILLSGQTESKTQVYDVKDKVWYPVYSDAGKNISSQTEGVEVSTTEDGEVKVVYNGTKKINYKAELTAEYWTQTIVLNGKITTSAAQKQKMNLETAKVTLNTAHNIQDNGKLAIGVEAKNNSTDIQKISYQVDKKNAKLFNEGYLSITFSRTEQKVYVGLNKDLRGDIKAGNYKVNLIGKILVDGREESMKPVPLTIVLTDKAPAVTLKAKGSIDLVQRQYTYIEYTPNIKNVTAGVERVILSGNYAQYFNAEVLWNGPVVVSAAESVPMSTKISYPLTMTLVLDNGCEVTSTVRIKPVNKLPKLKVGNNNQTIYKSNPEEVSYQVINSNWMTWIDRIEFVEDKNSQYFNCEFKSADGITVSLTEQGRKMKPGKYTISCKVFMEGAAYNVKPTTLKLTVIVK